MSNKIIEVEFDNIVKNNDHPYLETNLCSYIFNVAETVYRVRWRSLTILQQLDFLYKNLILLNAILIFCIKT